MAEKPAPGSIIPGGSFDEPWMMVTPDGGVQTVPEGTQFDLGGGAQITFDADGMPQSGLENPVSGAVLGAVKSVGSLPGEVAAGGLELLELGFRGMAGAMGSVGLDEGASGVQQTVQALDRGGEAIRGASLRQTPFFQANEFINPKADLLGDIAGQAVIPGGPGTQAVLGGLQGLGITNEAGGQALGGGLGAILPLAMGRLGRAGQRAASGALQRSAVAKPRTQHRAQAAATLQSNGVPITPGDAAVPGRLGARARSADLRRETIQGGSRADPMRHAQLDSMAEASTGPLGLRTTNLTNDYMAQVDELIDVKYDTVRELVQPLDGDALLENLEPVLERMGNYPGKVGDAPHQLWRVVDDAVNGRLDGRSWQAWRTELGEAARAADNTFEREAYYGVMQALDDTAKLQPGAGAAIEQANTLWKYRTLVLDKPGVRNNQGWLNSAGMVRNMQKAWPGIRRGRAPAEMKRIYDMHVAALQFPKIADSGTSQRLTATQGRSVVQRTKDAVRPQTTGGQIGSGAGRVSALEATDAVTDSDTDAGAE